MNDTRAIQAPATKEQLYQRLEELEDRLAIAEETLQAISSGEVDALVISAVGGERVFTLEGADHPYRVLVERLSEGTLTLTPEGLVLYANPYFAAIVKTEVDDIVGLPLSRFLPEADRARHVAFLEAGIEAEGRVELTMVAGDGTSIPVLVSFSRLDTGDDAKICAVVTDLTEQRRNAAMVAEERLSRLILEHAAEAIVVVDERGHILRASDSAALLAGQNPLLQPFDVVFPVKECELGTPVSSSILFTAIAREESIRGLAVEMWRPNGSIAMLLLGAAPLRDAAGKALASVVTLTDITELKRTEAALANQARQLEASNADLRQFAYSASHDLREPLRVITIYNQLLQQTYGPQLDDKARNLLDQTIEAGQRMDNLLRDLLDYTQAANTPQESEASADANVALDKALAALQVSIKENTAVIERGPLPVVRVHEVHLEQLFLNLLSNAIKYRGTADPQIRVAAERMGTTWVFCVADNGIGIDPKYHQQIFGIFKRLHGREKYSGSGIGLAICHKIVDQYGGKLWVDSDINQGARFYLSLPAAH